jgi:hypothetical protein
VYFIREEALKIFENFCFVVAREAWVARKLEEESASPLLTAGGLRFFHTINYYFLAAFTICWIIGVFF